MKFIKRVYTPVDQQGHWLSELNSLLVNAIKAEMYLKDCPSCGQDKTVIIYALLKDPYDRLLGGIFT